MVAFLIVAFILFCIAVVYALCQCAGRADDWADRLACSLAGELEEEEEDD